MAVAYNVWKWIEENKHSFLPPVCNKMMHSDGQMKVFFVGGPNARKDYHIEVGEEVVEHGQFVDIPILEGQLFLLPGRIAHSPQRKEATVGLVLERERLKGDSDTELDGLRYYVERDGRPVPEVLYEEWFYCDDLGTQLVPVIQRYFASEQCRTGQPLAGSISADPPVKLDAARTLQRPIDLRPWIAEHRRELAERGCKKVFEGNYQLQVFVYGAGESHDLGNERAETWIWQFDGSSTVLVDGQPPLELHADDCALIPANRRFAFRRSSDCAALLCYQDAALKATSFCSP